MDKRLKEGLKAGGRDLSESGDRMISDARDEAGSRIGPVQYKRGGKVRKTGMAKVHKNERVIPAGKRKKVERLMKRSGMSMKDNKIKSGRGSSGRTARFTGSKKRSGGRR